MPIPGTGECFRCRQKGHWAGECWTLKPPENRDHHEARIATYRDWCVEQNRVTPFEKQKLIEHENDMWKKKQKAA